MVNVRKKTPAGEKCFWRYLSSCCKKNFWPYLIPWQSKDALVHILSDLHEEDYFAVIKFDYIVLPWRDSLSKATKENVEEGKTFVRKHHPVGGTCLVDLRITVLTVLDTDPFHSLLLVLFQAQTST